MASTSSKRTSTSGKSVATSRAISSHNTIPWRCAFDLVTGQMAASVIARSKAKRIIRSTPRRVKIETSVATSSGKPR